jgi:hypothetical protein
MTTHERGPTNAAEPAAGGSEPAGRHAAPHDEWKHISGPSPSLVSVLSVLSAVTLVIAALYIAGVLTKPSLSNIEETDARSWAPPFELLETVRWVGPAFGEGVAVPETTR